MNENWDIEAGYKEYKNLCHKDAIASIRENAEGG